MAFPDEALEIVKSKPGKSTALATVLTGVNYQIPGFEHGELEVEVVEVTVTKGGKRIVRKAVVGEAPGQLQAAEPYPSNLIGLISLSALKPDCGRYHVRITRQIEGAWVCNF
jgi:hypothetical protein